MMNDPILLLNREHDIIRLAEKKLNGLAGIWKNDPKAYVKEIDDLLEFFVSYADGFHHSKEEDVLFPALRSHPEFTLPELLDEFEGHHESFRDYIREIEGELENENYSGVQELMTRYMDDLNDHIAAENEELFVLAENLLSENELETIYFRFVDINLERGAMEKARLEKLVDEK